jgi:LPXTG-motif cell wall-anchored protein
MSRPSLTRLAAGSLLGIVLTGAALVTAPGALAADLPAITPSSVSITPGQSFTLSGTGCVMQDGGYADVYVAAPSTFEGGVPAKPDGSWTMEVATYAMLQPGTVDLEITCGFYEEQYSYPPVTVTVVDATSKGTATVTVKDGVTHVTAAPGQSLTPQKPATPGQKFRVNFTGYTPGEVTSWVLHSTPRNLGTATADGSGVLSKALTIPSDVEPGDHTLRITRGDGSVVSYPIRIAASKKLAATGADVTVPLALGGALVVAGAGALVVSRRRSAGASQV